MKPVTLMPQLIGGFPQQGLHSHAVLRYRFLFPCAIKDSTVLYSLLKQHIDLGHGDWGVEVCSFPRKAIIIYVAHWEGQDTAQLERVLLKGIEQAALAIEKALADWAVIESIVEGVVNGDGDTDSGC